MKYRWLAAVALVLWGFGKMPLEQHLTAERRQLLAGEAWSLNYQLRDSLGQGLMLTALGGCRGLAADCLWISLTDAWREQQWERVQSLAELCVMLQPRTVFFWEMGAWHLAWNASISTEESGNPQRRQHDAHQWIEAGRRMLQRGILVNPQQPVLYQRLGDLYWQRLGDYAQAAAYYRLALQCPRAPVYLQRLVGVALERAGRERQAYEYWRQLWTDHPAHDQQLQRWEVIEAHIRRLEARLAIPEDQRLLPAAGSGTAL